MLGFIVGSIIYIKIISKYNFPILIKAFKLILNIINEIMKIVVYPFKLVSSLFKPGINKFSKLFKFLLKDIKRSFKIISNKK